MNNFDIILLNMVSIVMSMLSVYIVKGRVLTFLKNKELASKNYAGNRVYTGGGLVILFPCIFGILPYYIYGFVLDHIIYLAVVISMCLVGFMDDIAGDGGYKGIVRHVKAFFNGELTTGFIKAVIGCILGAIVALTGYHSLFGFLLNIIVFVLSINIMNLLDLRPGRAIKGFVFSIALFAALSRLSDLFIIIPVLTAIALYLKGELSEDYMLGDAGSNLIGGILGFYAVRVLTPTGKILFSVVLIVLHVLSEFTSFSKWIEAIPVLKYIDRLGRKKCGDNN